MAIFLLIEILDVINWGFGTHQFIENHNNMVFIGQRQKMTNKHTRRLLSYGM